MAYLHSPFETLATTEQGGSIAMAVMNAAYKHPRGSAYSQGLRDLIDSMLKASAAERPDIHMVSIEIWIWNRLILSFSEGYREDGRAITDSAVVALNLRFGSARFCTPLLIGRTISAFMAALRHPNASSSLA